MKSPDKLSIYDKQIYKNALLQKQTDMRIVKNAQTLQKIDLEVDSALRMRSFSTAMTEPTLATIRSQAPTLLTPAFTSILSPR